MIIDWNNHYAGAQTDTVFVYGCTNATPAPSTDNYGSMDLYQSMEMCWLLWVIKEIYDKATLN